ncbi:MAG: hypothetical protein WC877_01325 [Dehalococcoidales bacterium]|jgi:hypothetical protein
MTHYLVYFITRDNLLIEANSEDEAIKLAMDKKEDLCAGGSDWELDDSCPIETVNDDN